MIATIIPCQVCEEKFTHFQHRARGIKKKFCPNCAQRRASRRSRNAYQPKKTTKKETK